MSTLYLCHFRLLVEIAQHAYIHIHIQNVLLFCFYNIIICPSAIWNIVQSKAHIINVGKLSIRLIQVSVNVCLCMHHCATIISQMYLNFGLLRKIFHNVSIFDRYVQRQYFHFLDWRCWEIIQWLFFPLNLLVKFFRQIKGIY